MKIIVTFVVGLFVIVGAAFATPGVDVLGAPVHARGTNADELNIHSAAGIKLKTKGSVDFVTQYDHARAGRYDGLAQPSGPGAGDREDGRADARLRGRRACRAHYTAGQSFVDRGDETVHTALNLGPMTVELWATYLVPGDPGKVAFRIDAADPGNATSERRAGTARCASAAGRS